MSSSCRALRRDTVLVLVTFFKFILDRIATSTSCVHFVSHLILGRYTREGSDSGSIQTGSNLSTRGGFVGLISPQWRQHIDSEEPSSSSQTRLPCSGIYLYRTSIGIHLVPQDQPRFKIRHQIKARTSTRLRTVKFHLDRLYLTRRSASLHLKQSVSLFRETQTMSSDSQPKSKGKDAASIIAAASRPSKPAPQHTSFKNDDKKTVWCETQWTNLSIQAKKLDMPTLPYFDPETMLLSKEVNRKLWNQLVRYDLNQPMSLSTT